MKCDTGALPGPQEMLVPPTNQDALQENHDAFQAALQRDRDALQTSMPASLQREQDAFRASLQQDRDALQASMQREQDALQVSMHASVQAYMQREQDALQVSMHASMQASMQASLQREQDAFRASLQRDHDALQSSVLASLQASMQDPLQRDHASLQRTVVQQDYAALQTSQQQGYSESSGVQQKAPSPAQLDLTSLKSAAAVARRDFKAETLRRVQQHEVVRLTSVWCDADPAWSLELLRSAAPVLEELGACNLREEHLQAVHAMPRLRRLHLSVMDGALDAQPPLLPALQQPSTLQWLGLNGLPRATAQSLLRAHAAALDVLVLFLGAEPGQQWGDLDAFLGQCGLRLSQLVLWRWLDNHDSAVCAAQLAAARRAVTPDCSVRCSMCQKVPDKCFL